MRPLWRYLFTDSLVSCCTSYMCIGSQTWLLNCIACCCCCHYASCIVQAFVITLFCMVQVCDDRCDNMVQHDCLTYEGQSGSAMWSSNNQSIRGIVTGARTLSDGTTQNVGIKLNAFVYNTLSSWYNEDASEPLALVPVPPSSPASHRPYDDNAAASWFSDHLWIVVVPCVVGAAILLFLLCCLVSCIRRGCGRRPRQPAVAGPQSRIPQYPVGPHGTYASQYAQYAQHPQNQNPAANASPFAQSFYNNGDPSAPQGQNRKW